MKARRALSWPGRPATLALIRAAAATGCEILALESAPGFRFVPAAPKPPGDDAPSKRTLAMKATGNWRGLKNWKPAPMTYGPEDYRLPMAGDDPELTEARRAWAGVPGKKAPDPGPLREYLAALATRRAGKAPGAATGRATGRHRGPGRSGAATGPGRAARRCTGPTEAGRVDPPGRRAGEAMKESYRRAYVAEADKTGS